MVPYDLDVPHHATGSQVEIDDDLAGIVRRIRGGDVDVDELLRLEQSSFVFFETLLVELGADTRSDDFIELLSRHFQTGDAHVFNDEILFVFFGQLRFVDRLSRLRFRVQQVLFEIRLGRIFLFGSRAEGLSIRLVGAADYGGVDFGFGREEVAGINLI